MHDVIYYTVEDENGFIFEEFDTLKEAKRWFQKNKSECIDGNKDIYICGFRQVRDKYEDVVVEVTVYEKKVYSKQEKEN